MIFIDANLILAFDNVDEVHHEKAVSVWNEIVSCKYGPQITSDYVLNEVVGVTFRRFGKERAVRLGEHIMKTIPIFNVDDHILKEAWQIFSKTDLKLNLVDCTNLAVAKTTDAEFMATFDGEFKKVDKIKVVGQS